MKWFYIDYKQCKRILYGGQKILQNAQRGFESFPDDWEKLSCAWGPQGFQYPMKRTEQFTIPAWKRWCGRRDAINTDVWGLPCLGTKITFAHGRKEKFFYPTMTWRTAAFVTCWALRKWWNASLCSKNRKKRTLLWRLWLFGKIRNRLLLPGVCRMQK